MNTEIRQSPERYRQCFWSGDKGAEHAVRACCRIRLLNTSMSSRNDYEGMARVDVDTSSTKPWLDFVKGLITDERKALSILRSGAIHTQTRRCRTGRLPSDPQILCVLCDQPLPSARHLWAECAGTQSLRLEIGRQYRVPQTWWLNQPRVTAKSGWITLDAARDSSRRGVLQACSCAMGIKLISTVTKRLLDDQ